MKADRTPRGIAEALACLALIRGSALQTRNRLAFLLLDSVLEISIRIYLKHRKKIDLDPNKHKPRRIIVGMLVQKLPLDASIGDQLMYYYDEIRCPLYHEAADMTVTDVQLDDFQEVMCYLLERMFGENPKVYLVATAPPSNVEPDSSMRLDKLDTKVDAIVLSLGMSPARDSSSVLSHLRSLGYTGQLSANQISAYLSQGKYFYKDQADGLWKLTKFTGQQRLSRLKGASR